MGIIFLACLVFLSSRSFQSSDEQTDLELYGPVGIKDFVLTALRISGSRLAYRINFMKLIRLEKSLKMIVLKSIQICLTILFSAWVIAS